MELQRRVALVLRHARRSDDSANVEEPNPSLHPDANNDIHRIVQSQLKPILETLVYQQTVDEKRPWVRIKFYASPFLRTQLTATMMLPSLLQAIDGNPVLHDAVDQTIKTDAQWCEMFSSSTVKNAPLNGPFEQQKSEPWYSSLPTWGEHRHHSYLRFRRTLYNLTKENGTLDVDTGFSSIQSSSKLAIAIVITHGNALDAILRFITNSQLQMLSCNNLGIFVIEQRQQTKESTTSEGLPGCIHFDGVETIDALGIGDDAFVLPLLNFVTESSDNGDDEIRTKKEKKEDASEPSSASSPTRSGRTSEKSSRSSHSSEEEEEEESNSHAKTMERKIKESTNDGSNNASSEADHDDTSPKEASSSDDRQNSQLNEQRDSEQNQHSAEEEKVSINHTSDVVENVEKATQEEGERERKKNETEAKTNESQIAKKSKQINNNKRKRNLFSRIARWFARFLHRRK